MITLSFLFGGAAAVLALVFLWLWARRRFYDRYEEAKPPQHKLEALLSEIPEAIEIERKAAWLLVNNIHNDANKKQNAYHFWMALAVSAVLIGFIALGASVTVFVEAREYVKALASLDVICFVLALIAFKSGADVNRQWIRDRMPTEFMRQWAAVDDLLLGEADATTRQTLFSEALEEAKATCASGAEAFWRERKASLRAKAQSIGAINPDRLRCYLLRRPIRQFNWFHASHNRLSQQGKLREQVLLVFFFIVTILAGLKALAAWDAGPGWLVDLKPVISFAMLFVIGVSAALTALYFNQNARSLAHRYWMQKQRINAWLDKGETIFGYVFEKADAASSSLAFDHVLKFEDLMIEELQDWISITSKDKIEYAP